MLTRHQFDQSSGIHKLLFLQKQHGRLAYFLIAGAFQLDEGLYLPGCCGASSGDLRTEAFPSDRSSLFQVFGSTFRSAAGAAFASI